MGCARPPQPACQGGLPTRRSDVVCRVSSSLHPRCGSVVIEIVTETVTAMVSWTAYRVVWGQALGWAVMVETMAAAAAAMPGIWTGIGIESVTHGTVTEIVTVARETSVAVHLPRQVTGSAICERWHAGGTHRSCRAATETETATVAGREKLARLSAGTSETVATEIHETGTASESAIHGTRGT